MKTNKKRKENANARAEQNVGLTKNQKVAKLDARLGTGVGAKKERAKLAK